MVPREYLEESVVRTGRDFPAGGNPCLSKGLTSIHASVNNPGYWKIKFGCQLEGSCEK